MLTRSKAAVSKAAAAPASLSTPTAAAAASRAHSSLSADAHTNTQAHAQDQVEGVMGAADAANAAVASQPLSAPAAAHSLSGRKRAAGTQTDAAAQAADDASSLTDAVSDIPASAQRKKHRGECAHHSRSAVTAGLESADGEPTSAAAAASSNGRGASADGMADVPSPSSASTDECKEESQATGSGVVAVRASATESSSSSIAAAHADSSPAAPHLDDQLKLARHLLAEGIPLAEAELQRFEEQLAPLSAALTQGRAEAEAELQAILALPAAEQVAHQARQTQLQQRVSQRTQQLDNNARFLSLIRAKIDLARGAKAHLTATVRALGRTCAARWELNRILLPPDPSRGRREWMLQVDSLLTQLADRLPQFALTSDECRQLLIAAVESGALQLIPALMQQTNMQSNMQQGSVLLSQFLRACCACPLRHFVSHQPYLRLFQYGLDPTVPTRIFPQQSPLSVLQLARNLIRDHPPSAVEAAEATATAPAAAASSSSAPATHEPIPSVLAAWATQQSERTREAESLRRANLHAQFMHTLVPAWLSHSRAVLALLSSPAVLIPDLAVIVGRYLDLEGLPAEAAEAVDEDDVCTGTAQ